MISYVHEANAQNHLISPEKGTAFFRAGFSDTYLPEPMK